MLVPGLYPKLTVQYLQEVCYRNCYVNDVMSKKDFYDKSQ